MAWDGTAQQHLTGKSQLNHIAFAGLDGTLWGTSHRPDFELPAQVVLEMVDAINKGASVTFNGKKFTTIRSDTGTSWMGKSDKMSLYGCVGKTVCIIGLAKNAEGLNATVGYNELLKVHEGLTASGY